MITEKQVRRQVCLWIKAQYPHLIFKSDTTSGMKLSIGQAMQNKMLQSERGYPDLFIAEPRAEYHGLFIELKKDDSIYKKDGTLRENIHVKEQDLVLDKLREKGYYATFACGFENARNIIRYYLSL